MEPLMAKALTEKWLAFRQFAFGLVLHLPPLEEKHGFAMLFMARWGVKE
jgi:hypothetical protein